MKEKKKYTRAEIVMLIFCALGISLMAVSSFIETEVNLFSIAIALNGIGIMAFLYSQRSSKIPK